MHLAALAVSAILRIVPDAAASADSVAIGASSHVRFAPAAEAASVLTKRDAFLSAMSPFDRSARLQVGREVPEAEYLAFVAGEARDWTPAELELLRPMLEAFRAKTAKWKMDLPAEVLFLKTTGREEGRAAYCRGAAVVLPQNMIAGKPQDLRTTVFHELFHVYSSHHPEMRGALYAVVGYEVCPEFVLPPELARRKLTNPDAPRMDAFIRLRVGGETVAAAPILLGRSDLYDEKIGGAFFRQMDFRFLALAEDPAGGWRVATGPGAAGGARLIAPAEAPGYMDRIGHNTQYVIHPEEILADNFVLLADGAKAPSPDILEKLNAVLAR
ncbi:MAG TPA: hypothetical protein VH854_10355 [Thermoanaerobaculia bacterium]|jgi:hypothetical protein|nr:hypothetical protein [Thermoanaerobaculia bacterium]